MVTAEVVREQLGSLNKKVVSPIPAGMLTSRPPVHIFNVGKKRWTVPLGTFGTFTVLEADGERYSKPCVITGYVPEGVATDMKHIELRYELGENIAKEILGVGPFKDKSQDLTRFGVFISAGPVPTEEELLAAEGHLRDHYIKLVQEGDKFNSQGPLEVVNITAEHREAVLALNQSRPWAMLPKQMANCPGCGDPVNPGTAVHGGQFGCGAILDHDKAVALGLIQPTQAEPKQEKPKRA